MTTFTDVSPITDLKFGTSGLRGLSVELDGAPAYVYALAFARVLLARGAIRAGDKVLVGRDLRPSSPSIASRCMAGIRAAGLVSVDCGALPTPALAAYALALGAPAIMVTGSHIPEDRNGLKFYRADGEINKSDELAITEAAAAEPGSDGRADAKRDPRADAKRDPRAITAYRDRGVDMLATGALAGMRVGVYQHSSVARDLIVEVLTALGAEAVPLGRSDAFVPVDTEALRPEDLALALQWAGAQHLDAIVSTDGDADRPMIADQTGRYLRGDLVGAVTAHILGADCIVTPVSSNSGIERSGRFARVLRSRIGSPYVIEGMQRAVAEGARCVVGFEANGGVLLGSDADIDGRVLKALPTRDALSPILATLHASHKSGRPLSSFAADFAFGAAASGRLKDIPASASAPFLERLRNDVDFRVAFVGDALVVDSVDTTDGVRMTANNGAVLHYRASGNAPELRCYAEASSETSVEALLTDGLARAGEYLKER